jgi:hypothetical protein
MYIIEVYVYMYICYAEARMHEYSMDDLNAKLNEILKLYDIAQYV